MSNEFQEQFYNIEFRIVSITLTKCMCKSLTKIANNFAMENITEKVIISHY